MKKITRFAIIISVAFLLAPKPAESLMEMSLGYGTQSIGGNVQYQGTTLSAQDNLGLGDEGQVMFKLKAEHSVPFLPNLYLNYIPSKFSGSKTNTTTVSYGGATFDANTLIETNLKLNRFDIGFFYNAIDTDSIDIEIGLNVKVLQFDGSLKGTVGGVVGTEEKKSMTVPVPQLYLGASVTPIKYLTFGGDIKYVSYNSNKLSNFDIFVSVKPIPVMYISLGYFKETLKVDTSDVVTDLSISQPYLAIGADF